jgi:hypothetical protein
MQTNYSRDIVYIKICTAHQARQHRPEHERQAVRLHQAISKIFVEFYIAKVYINVVFHRRRQKPCRRRDLRSPLPPTTRPAAAVIFDCRRRDL